MPSIRDVEEAVQAFSGVEVDIRFDPLQEQRAFSVAFKAVRRGATEQYGTVNSLKQGQAHWPPMEASLRARQNGR